MLSNSLLTQSLLVAGQLGDEGLDIAPHHDSLLAELVSASMPPIINEDGCVRTTNATDAVPGLTEGVKAEWFVEDVARTTAVIDEDVASGCHSVRIASIADDIAPFVTSHISFARNTVAPLVGELEAAVLGFVEKTKSNNPATEFEIVQGIIPPLVLDESFMNMGLDDITNMKPVTVDASYVMVSVENPDEVVSSITSLGSDRLNAVMSETLKKGPYDLIRRVLFANYLRTENGWVDSKNFYGVDVGEGGYDFYTDYMVSSSLENQNPYKVLYVALADFIITKWLRENTQKTDSDTTLDAYNLFFDQRNAAAGVMVKNALNRVKLQIETNVMVCESNPITKKVVVHAPVYRQWLEAGGCPEALLGFLVTNNMTFNAGVLLEKKDEGCRAWENYLLYRNHDIETNMKDAVRSFIRSYMSRALEDLSENEKEYQQNCTNLKEQVMKRVEEEIQHFDHRILEDISHVALHMVAKARFFYTSAYSILNEMVQVEKANPDIDPREAAAISAYIYVVDYIDSMINIPGKLGQAS